eukprot:scaffold3356_cov112-Isochrysis_galbana.AAC.11
MPSPEPPAHASRQPGACCCARAVGEKASSASHALASPALAPPHRRGLPADAARISAARASVCACSRRWHSIMKALWCTRRSVTGHRYGAAPAPPPLTPRCRATRASASSASTNISISRVLPEPTLPWMKRPRGAAGRRGGAGALGGSAAKAAAPADPALPESVATCAAASAAPIPVRQNGCRSS